MGPAYTSFAKKLFIPLEAEYLKSQNYFDYGSARAFYGSRREQIEAWLRPLWIVSSLLDIDAVSSDVLERILKGIKDGVDPRSELYWGDLTDNDQLIAELPGLSFFIMNHSALFYDNFSREEIANLTRYLDQANHVAIPKNNWLFFRVLINCALQTFGHSSSTSYIDAAMDQIDECYQGNGWYSDGGRLDYYNAWAFHFYGLIYAKYVTQSDPETHEKLVARARRFAKDFCLFFDSKTGASIPYGRSMLYRFCMGSFFAAVLYADADVLPRNVAAQYLQTHMAYWSRQDIFDDKGFLMLGFLYPNDSFLEDYNGFGSAYWAVKSFIALPFPAMPTASKQQSLTNDTSKRCIAGTMLLRNGVLYPGDQALFETYGKEKYRKFAYSWRASFSIENDNHLLITADGSKHYKSGEPQQSRIRFGQLFHNWQPSTELKVISWIIPLCHSHVRIHYVRNYGRAHLVINDYGFPLDDKDRACVSAKRLFVSTPLRLAKGSSLYHKECYTPYIETATKRKRFFLITCFSDGQQKV